MHGKIGRDKIQDWSGSDSFTLNNSDADIESDKLSIRKLNFRNHIIKLRKWKVNINHK